MRILVDMDNTIADFNTAIEKLWRERHPDLSYIASEELKEWRVESSYATLLGTEAAREIEDIYCSIEFYDHVEPIPGAIEAINEMLSEGHDVRICTAYVRGRYNMLSGKMKWLDKYLGKTWEDRIILSRDKTCITGDVLVDDRLEITGSFTPVWKQIVFDRPYNRSSDLSRVTDWSKWRETIV